MKFKQYMKELANFDVGQFQVYEPISTQEVDSKTFEEVNNHLDQELSEFILTPEQGVQKIRKVLLRYALHMPVLFDLDSTGNEYVIEIENAIDTYVYIIYYLTDDGNYDFYAEMIRENDIDEILSDDEDDEIEE